MEQRLCAHPAQSLAIAGSSAHHMALLRARFDDVVTAFVEQCTQHEDPLRFSTKVAHAD